MKKLVFLVLACVAVSFSACDNNKAAGNGEQDSLAVDSAVVDSTVVDSVEVDSIAVADSI